MTEHNHETLLEVCQCMVCITRAAQESNKDQRRIVLKSELKSLLKATHESWFGTKNRAELILRIGSILKLI